MGPITIFDKSALQALNIDETVWLEAYFLSNVTPLFYVETLADLEKAVAEGRTPEAVVASLADKTPSDAYPNVYHRTLIEAELQGQEIEMSGRVMVAAGEYRRAPDGSLGMHIDEFPEAAMLLRWKNHEFNEAEREVARRWREELATHEPDRMIGIVRNILPVGSRISDLEALKRAVDDFCEGNEREVVTLALHVLEVPDRAQTTVLERWEAARSPSLPTFAPYTTHVFKVDLVYYLGIDRGFISGERASNKADMRISITCRSRWSSCPGTDFIAARRRSSSWPSSRMSTQMSSRRGCLLFLTGMFSLSTVAVYYARDVLGNANLYIVMTLVQTVAMVAAAAFVPKLVARAGKKRAYVLAGAVGAASAVAFALAPGHLPAIAIACYGFLGLGFGAINALIFALQADTVEYGEWRSGVRAEGASYSVLSFMRKAGQGIGGAAAAYTIGLGGYVSGAASQSDAAITSIRVAAGVVPAVAVAAAAAVMLAYPLTERAFRTLVAELAERRAAGPEETP